MLYLVNTFFSLHAHNRFNILPSKNSHTAIALIFFNDGVYHLQPEHTNQIFLHQFLSEYPNLTYYALAPDLQARGLVLPDDFLCQMITYVEFVELTAKHEHICYLP